jgi:hypothetical protein
MNAEQLEASDLAGRKVNLESPRVNPYAYQNPRSGIITLSKSLPYFRSSVGNYMHRVRWAQHHLFDGEYKHTAIRMWCGQVGFAGSKEMHRGGGHFFSLVPNDAVICATCEGRAIGAGQDGSHKINGRIVRYAPRANR